MIARTRITRTSTKTAHAPYRRTGTLRSYWKYRNLTLMLLPGIVYYFVFHYVPIYGVIIAFKDYSFSAGIWGSRWVGLEHFRLLLSRDSFWEVFRNTIVINGLKLIFGFPAPIVLAILLNEVRTAFFKRFVQTVSYLPHFLSWVILSGILMEFLSPPPVRSTSSCRR
ncbi:hypothetical protein N6H14_05410 [Paenibacillus sp. CC-CFT747]|nr:hypothetical protein N6H14_05410 [Paenibacillus sp. CC-CFT747]